IATSSGQAARLVTQLLALARAENRASGLSFEPVDLAALARVTVRDWVQAAFARHMDLGYEGPDDQDVQAPAPIIDGHAVMLREMLGNLIDNAIRYTPEGGRITVRLHVEPGVRLDATGAVVRAFDNAGAGQASVAHIALQDTGPGIPAHERGRVLERFYRIL
ncbi:sensor histidine kinase, partial [Paraburkholderia bryophila]|uniref:sensor histidine kinase n=1 Tax=Paraburkholderia bryophila TaxID=420952 RepID=UPI001FC8A471